MYSAHRSSHRSEDFHMYPLDLSSTSISLGSSSFRHAYTNTTTSATDALNGQPLLPRRRSHRPRGCRGGRKNRKNFSGVGASTSPTSSTSFGQPKGLLFENVSIMPRNDSYHYTHSKARSADLSPYQHVKTLKVWDFNATTHDNEACPVSMSAPQKPLMMLPPPVPSALFDIHQSGLEPAGGDGLKMLPSFDESDSASESLIPPPMHTTTNINRLTLSPQSQNHTMNSLALFGAQFPIRADEATIEALASNSSGSSDDCDTVSSNASGGWFNPSVASTARCYNSHTAFTIELPRAPASTFHQYEFDSGSLFVTSPRSFLLRELSQNPRQPPVTLPAAPGATTATSVF